VVWLQRAGPLPVGRAQARRRRHPQARGRAGRGALHGAWRGARAHARRGSHGRRLDPPPPPPPRPPPRPPPPPPALPRPQILAPTDDAFDQLLTQMGGGSKLPESALLARPELKDVRGGAGAERGGEAQDKLDPPPQSPGTLGPDALRGRGAETLYRSSSITSSPVCTPAVSPEGWEAPRAFEGGRRAQGGLRHPR
jgi:hypothetical protein